MPRRGVVLLLAVVAAGATAAALVLPDEEERQGRPPPSATESPGPAETESAPPTDVPESEAQAPGRGDGPRLVIGFVDDPSFRWRPYREQMRIAWALRALPAASCGISAGSSVAF